MYKVHLYKCSEKNKFFTTIWYEKDMLLYRRSRGIFTSLVTPLYVEHSSRNNTIEHRWDNL